MGRAFRGISTVLMLSAMMAGTAVAGIPRGLMLIGDEQTGDETTGVTIARGHAEVSVEKLRSPSAGRTGFAPLRNRGCCNSPCPGEPCFRRSSGRCLISAARPAGAARSQSAGPRERAFRTGRWHHARHRVHRARAAGRPHDHDRVGLSKPWGSVDCKDCRQRCRRWSLPDRSCTASARTTRRRPPPRPCRRFAA